MRPCVHCGKQFEPPLKQVRICSKECRRLRGVEQTNMRYKPRGEARRECAQCGKTFKTSHGIQKTCGKECAREYRLQGIRDWHRESARKKENEALRRRCAEILAAVPPGSMTEDEGMEYARNELETKRLLKTRAGRRQVKKECVQCGREFVPKHHRQINCSKECSTAHGKARSKVIYDLLHKKEANPACVQCGKTITSRTRRVTCSAGCARDRQIQLTRSKRAPYSREEAERECVQCGKIFSTKHPNKISCSAECARKRHVRQVHRRYTPRRRQEMQKECAQCGDAFKTSYPKRRVCGDKCAKVWNREHRKKRRAPAYPRLTI